MDIPVHKVMFMRALAILVLSVIVLIGTGYFLAFSACAISGGSGISAGDRITASVFALVTLAAVLGLVSLIRKLNREQ
jgi:Ni,Fe-hydrogenase I cytochrome b subunit